MKRQRKSNQPVKTSSQQAELDSLRRICAESYQVVGSLASSAGLFDHPAVIKAMDNLSDQELTHDDVLPFRAEVEQVEVSSVVEAGPWKVDDWGDGRVAIQSDDFTHDVALELTGDFAKPEHKLRHAQEIARRLNAHVSSGAAPGDDQADKTEPLE